MHSVCEHFGNQPCSRGSTAPCCDTFGEFLSTAFSCHLSTTGSHEKSLGYCNAGECHAHVCNYFTEQKPLFVFCGSSKINPCKASCSSDSNSKCYDTVWFPNGGEDLQDGAVCKKDFHTGADRLYGNRKPSLCLLLVTFHLTYKAN